MWRNLQGRFSASCDCRCVRVISLWLGPWPEWHLLVKQGQNCWSITSSASVRSVLRVLAWSFLKLLPDHYHMPEEGLAQTYSGAKQKDVSPYLVPERLVKRAVSWSSYFGALRSMFLIKWHQEALQDFLFKDLMRSYLLSMSCFIPFPIQSCQEKSKTLHFLFPPLFQWTWEYVVTHIFHGTENPTTLILSPSISGRSVHTGTDSGTKFWGLQRPTPSLTSGVHISIPPQSSKADLSLEFISIQVLDT